MGERVINGIPFDANAIIDQEGEVSYDYVLFAEDIAQWLRTYFGNGILVPKAALMTTQFQVLKVNETQVSINKGNIVINGRTGFLKNPYNMDIDYAHAGKQRIDRVVIELNTNETVNEFRPLVLKGVESEQNPQIPDITRDEYLGIYQMSLANILVTADGVQTITDERNDSNLCGVSQVLIGVKPAVPVTGDSALNISYDNSYTGAEEQTVQDALDNLYNTKKKILLDGVDQKELKLSYNYQWVDKIGIDFSSILGTSEVMLVEYKGEMHIFIHKSTDNHFKVADNVLVSDIDCPVYNTWSNNKKGFCSDDKYIYAIGKWQDTDSIYKLAVFRFDGSAWEKIFILTPQATSSETINSVSALSVHNNKLYFSAYTTTGHGSSLKSYYYAGYIDLDTFSWNSLTLPSDSYYGYTYFTEIDGILYIFGSSDTSGYFIYKMNGDNSWTQFIGIMVSKYNYNSSFLITSGNKAYILLYGGFYCFDGSKIELITMTDAILKSSLAVINNKFYVIGNVYKNPSSSDGCTHYNVCKVLEKVLCLED